MFAFLVNHNNNNDDDDDDDDNNNNNNNNNSNNNNNRNDDDDDNDDVDDDDNVCLCSGGADKETTTTRSGPWHGSFLILSLNMICKDMHIYLQYNDVCITNFKEDIFLQISREMYENYKKRKLITN